MADLSAPLALCAHGRTELVGAGLGEGWPQAYRDQMAEIGFTEDESEKWLKLPPAHPDHAQARKHILSVVQQTAGLSAAADRLGVTEQTLNGWIQEIDVLRHALRDLPRGAE